MELATLAKIDPDVRLQIYQEMFRDVIITANITKDDAFPEDEPTLKFTHKPQHSLSILRTCRAVYNEAIPELWSTARVTGRTIMLDTDDEYGDMNYAKLNDLTRCIPPTIQVQIRHLRSVVLSPASQNLNKTNNKNNDDNLAAFPALRTLEIRQLGSGSKAVGDPLPTTTLSGVPVALCDGDGNSSRPRTDLTLTQKVPLHKTVYRFATLTTAQRNLAPLDYLALSYKLGDIWTRNPRLQVFSKGVLGHVEHGRNLTEAGSATCHLMGMFHYNSGLCWTELVEGRWADVSNRDAEQNYSDILAVSRREASLRLGLRLASPVRVGQVVDGLELDQEAAEWWNEIVETQRSARFAWTY